MLVSHVTSICIKKNEIGSTIIITRRLIRLVGSLMRKGRLTDNSINRIMSRNKLTHLYDALLFIRVIGWYGADIIGWGLSVAMIGWRMLPKYGHQHVIRTVVTWADIGTAPRYSVAGDVQIFFLYPKASRVAMHKPSTEVRGPDRKFDNSPESNAEVKYERYYTSRPTHTVMAWAETDVSLVTDCCNSEIRIDLH
jgi:hypothetical protein